MPGHIPGTGSISIGDAAGSGRSLNELRNIKRSTTVNANMSMSTLRDWFRDFVDGGGDGAGLFPDTGDRISFSQFRNMTIFGIQVEAQNETDTTYDNSEDARLRVNGIHGTEDFTFRLTGPEGYDVTISPVGAADALFNGLGGANNNSRDYEYTLTCTDDNTNASFEVIFRCDEGTAPSEMIGTTTSGGDGEVYTFGTPSSTAYGDTITIYVQDPDPSGESYG